MMLKHEDHPHLRPFSMYVYSILVYFVKSMCSEIGILILPEKFAEMAR